MLCEHLICLASWLGIRNKKCWVMRAKDWIWNSTLLTTLGLFQGLQNTRGQLHQHVFEQLLRAQKKLKKTVKSSAEKKLTNLLYYCISADLHLMLCAQVWWNWPQHPPNVCQNLPINPGTAIEVCVTPSIQNLKLAINASLLFVYTGQSWFQSNKVFYNCTLDTFTWDIFFFFFFTSTSSLIVLFPIILSDFIFFYYKMY